MSEYSQQLQDDMNGYWSGRAESYGDQNRAQLDTDCNDKWYAIIHQYAKADRQLKVLDIGTGPGFFAILMAQHGHQVTGVDLNAEMLQQARQNAALHQVSVEWIQIDGKLPFADETFDLILSRDVTWCQQEPEKTFSEWFRVLKQGGRMLYFDAEYYNYLQTQESLQKHRDYRRYVAENNGFVYARANSLEEMAYSLPMTWRSRPAWDQAFWKEEGASAVFCETDLNARVYSAKEQMQYGEFPLFLVCVEK